MPAEISSHNEDFINRQVAAGEYADRSAALDAAIELLRNRSRTLEKIDNGRRQLETGEFNQYDDDETLRQRFDDLKQRARNAASDSE